MAQAPEPLTDGTGPQTGGGPGETRRKVLLGVGAVGVAGLAAACGGDDGKDDSSGDAGSGQTPTQSSGNGAGGAVLAKTADIPVGGGKIFKKEKVVVVQPAAGQFKAYDATCTHKGCPVSQISGDTIKCKCHGSEFKISDGSVANPPATEPLAEKKITVQGGSITLA
ncbi:Rieske (2Fe-2S) protein [Spirillospora sp. CA-294931]|uniref:Rieske (2Fe-2S) protein n=1 Tax=Spirillospora sp. CA-294931 TaxID=3240042 RepID=UPI003D90A6C0